MDPITPEELAALEHCIDIAASYWDEGPSGEGWQSDELSAAVQTARDLLERLQQDNT